MDKKKAIYIFGSAAVLLLLFFVLSREWSSKYTWAETYDQEYKDPYGTHVIYELLSKRYPGERFRLINTDLGKELPAQTSQTANYIFVGEGLYLDSVEVDQLLRFVEGGNQAFISSKSISADLMDEIYPKVCGGYYWDDYYDFRDTSVQLNLVHNNLKEVDGGYKYQFIYQHKPIAYRWHFIDSIYFCDGDSSLIELGTIDSSKVNFAQIAYGEGTFYLHTNPLAFSNFQLLDRPGLSYVGKVFSHLKAGAIYWDGANRVSEEVSRRINESRSDRESGGRLSSNSPLQYILAQAPLAWAWYIALVMVVLYLFFGARRRQRIIPVLAPNTNSSMDFISTIGSLYFMRQDHRKLSLQKMKLFLAYIRERYHLSTSELDEPFAQKLASHSEVSRNIIDKILLINKNINSSKFVSEKTLIEFHLIMDQFYKQCK
ncbi:MAG: DUF4350 domain-containing protein [Bacteroidota bacterium]